MPILSIILITIAFILFMVPSLTWCYISVKRNSGEISWKLQKFHRKSWFIFLPISIVVTTIGLLINLI